MFQSLRLLALAASVVIGVNYSAAAGGGSSITFLGEDYAVAHRDAGETGNSLVEFVRGGEAIEAWKKLVAVHGFPGNAESPKDAVLIFASVLKERDPDTRYAIAEHPETKEAMIDFLAAQPDSEIMEFNVFKYSRHPSGKGLVALQFAQRFILGEADSDTVKAVREAAVAEAAKFDLSTVINHLGE